MFHHRMDRETPRITILHWFLLSVIAGMVNTGGLLACGSFVSHVTGIYAHFGRNAGNLTWDTAVGLLSVPFYFSMGVMISAFFVERPKHRGGKSHYALVMTLALACLILATALGQWGYFGTFGDNELKTEYLLLALLCLASGLQNGATSVATSNAVRPTHMTGTTTDIAVGVVRVWSLPKDATRRKDEISGLKMRCGLIVSFILGCAMGAELYIRFEYLGFLVHAALVVYTIIWELVTTRDQTSPNQKSAAFTVTS
jgi:uncharacterized membrane protein YoaK (UPF0700 family)